jgi:hypothetical protein
VAQAVLLQAQSPEVQTPVLPKKKKNRERENNPTRAARLGAFLPCAFSVYPDHEQRLVTL